MSKTEKLPFWLFQRHQRTVVSYERNGKEAVVSYERNGKEAVVSYERNGKEVVSYERNGKEAVVSYERNGKEAVVIKVFISILGKTHCYIYQIQLFEFLLNCGHEA
jgi:hypothetical protein